MRMVGVWIMWGRGKGPTKGGAPKEEVKLGARGHPREVKVVSLAEVRILRPSAPREKEKGVLRDIRGDPLLRERERVILGIKGKVKAFTR